MSQGEFVRGAQISLVLPSSHFTVAILVRLAALFFLLTDGEVPVFTREVKGGTPGQPGKPVRRVRREVLLPSVRIVDEVVLSTAEMLDHRVQPRGCHMHSSFLLGIFTPHYSRT